MEKNSTLILVLVILTATITLVTKVVELWSSWLKFRIDHKRPTEISERSIPIKTQRRFPWVRASMLLANFIGLASGMLGICLMALDGQSTVPLTRRDMAYVVMYGVTVIVSGLVLAKDDRAVKKGN